MILICFGHVVRESTHITHTPETKHTSSCIQSIEMSTKAYKINLGTVSTFKDLNENGERPETCPSGLIDLTVIPLIQKSTQSYMYYDDVIRPKNGSTILPLLEKHPSPPKA